MLIVTSNLNSDPIGTSKPALTAPCHRDLRHRVPDRCIMRLSGLIPCARSRKSEGIERRPMTSLKLYLFGPPRLEHAGQPIELNLRKALALLVYLAVSGQPHSRD